MGRIIFGGILLGLGLIYDACTTAWGFSKGAYVDKVLKDKVWDAIVSLSTGMVMVGLLGWLLFAIWNCDL